MPGFFPRFKVCQARAFRSIPRKTGTWEETSPAPATNPEFRRSTGQECPGYGERRNPGLTFHLLPLLGAWFSRAGLQGVGLQGAGLQGVGLQGAGLQGAGLQAPKARSIPAWAIRPRIVAEMRRRAESPSHALPASLGLSALGQGLTARPGPLAQAGMRRAFGAGERPSLLHGFGKRPFRDRPPLMGALCGIPSHFSEVSHGSSQRL